MPESTLIDGVAGAGVAVTDRGLHYGDGLFETVAVRTGRPELWPRHLERLGRGCERLGIPLPDSDRLREEVDRVCSGIERGVVKLILTRGSGGRGYRPPEDPSPTRIVARYPWPDHPPAWWQDGIAVRLCRQRLALNPALAGIKHLNRLEQVLARREWCDAAIAEGLMLDYLDRVIEGTQSNLFVVRDGRLLTPDLAQTGIEGVMRGLIIETADGLDQSCETASITVADLLCAEELFVCNSVIGIWPIRCLEAVTYPAPGPLTRRLAAAVEEARRS